MNYGRLIYLEITENLKNLPFHSSWGNTFAFLKIVFKICIHCTAGIAALYQYELCILSKPNKFHYYIVTFLSSKEKQT